MHIPANLADYNSASLRELEGLVHKNPDDAFGHLVLGFKLADARQFDQAEASFRRVIEIDPEHSEAHHFLGRTLLDRNRAREALECFNVATIHMERYCERDDRPLTINRSDNNLFRARAFAQLGQINEAREAATECLRDNPFDVRATMLRASLK